MQRTSFKESRIPFHYGWIVAGVTFLVLIVTADVRATPGVLMVPLEAEFGWSRAAIAAAVAINITLAASLAAFGAGAIRTVSGGYELAFWIAGILCVLAGTTFLTVGRRSFSSVAATEAIAVAPA